MPALIVAAAESGVADLKTVTALTSSEMKSAFVKAGPIAASYRSAVARAASPSSAEPQTDLSNPGSQHEGETAREAQDDVKAATAILNAEKKPWRIYEPDVQRPTTSLRQPRQLRRNPLRLRVLPTAPMQQIR